MDHVRQRRDLVEVFGDQQHRRPPIPGGKELFVHVGQRADVKATHGLVGQHHRRRGLKHAPQDQLLHVAAESSRMRVSGPGQRTS